MRYTELFEAVARYRPMYNGIVPLQEFDVTNAIEKAENTFKREDRIVWYLRHHRLWYAYEVNKHHRDEVTGDIPENHEEVMVPYRTIEKYKAAIGARDLRDEDAYARAHDVILATIDLKHYVDMDLAKINAIVWDRQELDELLDTMRDIEEEWQERLSNAITPRAEDEKLIDFGNGWAWWRLNRSSCREEANAMGHCGNAGGSHGHRILSLRKHIEDDYWEPHLTFIIDADGSLGEMKGRANQKPATRYHEMILALLKSDEVEDVVGGGYMPQNNFALGDLTDEQYKALIAEKPTLRPFHDIFAEYQEAKKANGDDAKKVPQELRDNMLNKLKKELGQWTYEKIDADEEEIIIDTTTAAHFNDDAVDAIEALFTDLESIIASNTHGLDVDSYSLAQTVRNVWRTELLKELAGRGNNYRLDVWCEYDADHDWIVEKLSFWSFAYTDDEEFGSVSRLDEIYDSSDADYESVDYPDHPVGAAVFDWVIENAKSRTRGVGQTSAETEYEMVLAILADYGTGLYKPHNYFGSPTTRDPRQMKFDFGDKKD